MGLKFHFFPTAFRDETLHSILSRYARLCGSGSCRAVFDQSRSAACFSQNVALPCQLDDLIQALPAGTGLSVAEVIKRHTQLPYYEPFLTHHQVNHAHAMMAGRGKGIMLKLGVTASRLEFASRVRFCPDCICSDLASVGAAYWHRAHQFPGVLICPNHGTVLHIVDPGWSSRNSRRLSLPDDDFIQSHSLALEVPTAFHPALSEIAKRSVQVLETDCSALSAYKLRSVLLEGGTALDLVSSCGRLYLDRLSRHLSQYFKSLPASWEYSVLGEVHDDAPPTWVTKLLRKPRSTHHPLKYVLLADALHIDMDKLLAVTSSPAPMLVPNIRVEDPAIPACTDHEHIVCSGLSDALMSVWTRATDGADAKTIASEIGVSRAYVYRTIRAIEEGPSHWRAARSTKELGERRSRFQLDYRARLAHQCTDYPWLHRHDRQWLSVCIQERCGCHSTQTKRNGSFLRLDEELAAQIIRCAEKLRSLPGKPVRISRTRIGRELHVLSRLEKQLSKLPLCASALDAACETCDAFRKRRLRWAEQKLRDGNQPITQSALYRTACIRRGA